MTDHLLDRLSTANPVTRVNTAEAELAVLLENVFSAPERRTATAPRLVRVGLSVVASAVVYVALVVALGQRATPDAAARAYAAVAPKPGEILHTTYTLRVVNAAGQVTRLEHDETWSMPGRYRTVLRRTVPSAGRAEFAVDDGSAIQRGPHGTVAPLPFSAQVAVPPLPGNRFRELYRRGVVHQHGEERVAGRRALRFTMQNGDAEISYVVDPTNFRPLLLRITDRNLQTGQIKTTATTLVTSYDLLPDMPNSRALLSLRRR